MEIAAEPRLAEGIDRRRDFAFVLGLALVLSVSAIWSTVIITVLEIFLATFWVDVVFRGANNNFFRMTYERRVVGKTSLLYS